MNLETTSIDGLMVITPKVRRDARGLFAEIYRQDVFERAGVCATFVQDNQSLSRKAHVIRGLHFQSPPFGQAKLMRVVHGSILDVAVDIRQGSPTFGKSFSIELSARTMKQLFIPEGFAHGFLTLEPDTEVAYKVSSPYAPSHDHGVFWADPDLEIPWNVSAREVELSARDSGLPRLRDITSPFSCRASPCGVDRLAGVSA